MLIPFFRKKKKMLWTVFLTTKNISLVLNFSSSLSRSFLNYVLISLWFSAKFHFLLSFLCAVWSCRSNSVFKRVIMNRSTYSTLRKGCKEYVNAWEDVVVPHWSEPQPMTAWRIIRYSVHISVFFMYWNHQL